MDVTHRQPLVLGVLRLLFRSFLFRPLMNGKGCLSSFLIPPEPRPHEVLLVDSFFSLPGVPPSLGPSTRRRFSRLADRLSLATWSKRLAKVCVFALHVKSCPCLSSIGAQSRNAALYPAALLPPLTLSPSPKSLERRTPL